MKVELEQILQAGLAILLAVVGYIVGVLKMLHMKNEKVSNDLTAHKVEVARDYVPRKDFTELRVELNHRFDKFEQSFKDTIKEQNQWMGRRFDAMMGRQADNKSE